MKRLINVIPDRRWQFALGALPFILLGILYLVSAEMRHAANPNDKLLPLLPQISAAIDRLAFTENVRSGNYDFWVDTFASLKRLFVGVGISALIGLCFGIASGSLPLARAGMSPLTTAISMVPPMAVLPILFIVFGLGELAKVVLIVFGIAPVIVRDMQLRTMEIPSEMTIKAQTLGASSWQYILRVVLPQVMPRLITAIRLSLGPAWLYVIAAEAIAATEGLGYRIFLVRRYLAMDVILPYVVWITILALVMDYALKLMQRKLYPWVDG
jgi:NitT/TauT family transport system permease protein